MWLTLQKKFKSSKKGVTSLIILFFNYQFKETEDVHTLAQLRAIF